MSTAYIHDNQQRCGLALSFAAGFAFSFRVSITFLWFQSNPQLGTVASTALSVVLFISACWIALVNPATHTVPASSNATMKLIIAYLTLSGVSVLWSNTKSVPVAIGYWAGTTCDVLTLVLLLRYSPLEDRVVRVLEGYVMGAAVVAAIAWHAPAMYDSRLGDEDFLHPNAIGFVFALAALFSIYLVKEHRLWKWLAFGLSVTLLRSLSKSCIAAFLVAGTVYLLFGLTLSRRAKIFIGLVTSCTVLFFWGLIESYYTFYAAGTSNVETLTGRTLIWSESFTIARESPWFGHGFYSYRFVVPPFGDFEAWHAHNDFLQQFFNYGLVGLAVTVVLYYTFYKGVRQSCSEALRALSVAILLFTLIRGTVDTERFDLAFPLWLMATLSVPLSVRKQQSESTSE